MKLSLLVLLVVLIVLVLAAPAVASAPTAPTAQKTNGGQVIGCTALVDITPIAYPCHASSSVIQHRSTIPNVRIKAGSSGMGLTYPSSEYGNYACGRIRVTYTPKGDIGWVSGWAVRCYTLP